MGIAYGSTACMFSCAPMLMPLLIRNSSTLSRSMRVVGIFSMGRIFSYTLISILASVASFSVKEVLNNPEITQPLMGLIMVFSAVYLIYQQFFPATVHKCGVKYYTKRRDRLSTSSYFVMGAMLSLSLCAPLLSLVAVSAASSSILRASLYGLMFGLGTVLVSLILYGFIFATIAKGLLIQFNRQKRWIELIASFLLLFAGIMVISGRLKL